MTIIAKRTEGAFDDLMVGDLINAHDSGCP